MSECYLPAARTAKLVVRELADEVLVYDTEAHRAHCLNRTAALVWKSCDGETPVSRIAERVGLQLSSPVAEEVVWLALGRLAELDLLSPSASPRPAPPNQMSRRRLLRRLGAAAAAVSLPLVTSIVSPTPAQAQSGVPCDENTPCPEGQTCNAGICE